MGVAAFKRQRLKMQAIKCALAKTLWGKHFLFGARKKNTYSYHLCEPSSKHNAQSAGM